MNIRQSSLCCFVLFVLATVSTASAFKTSDSEMIEFPGWDHSQIMSSAGQSFQDVCGDVDVVVTAAGGFAAPTAFGTTNAGVGSVRFDAAAPSANQMFTFTFSEPIPLVVDFDLLDPQEQMTITSNGSTPAYTHASGQLPVTSFPTLPAATLELQGSAYGPGGAAMGFASLGMVSQVTVAYDINGAVTTKYNAFTLSKASVVPEPNSQGLVAMGLIGLFGFGRKRRKA